MIMAGMGYACIYIFARGPSGNRHANLKLLILDEMVPICTHLKNIYYYFWSEWLIVFTSEHNWYSLHISSVHISTCFSLVFKIYDIHKSKILNYFWFMDLWYTYPMFTLSSTIIKSNKHLGVEKDKQTKKMFTKAYLAVC